MRQVTTAVLMFNYLDSEGNQHYQRVAKEMLADDPDAFFHKKYERSGSVELQATAENNRLLVTNDSEHSLKVSVPGDVSLKVPANDFLYLPNVAKGQIEVLCHVKEVQKFTVTINEGLG